MKQVAQRCEQCGGPMQIVSHGGQEPDPDRRGKYRPSTTAQIACVDAMEEQRRAIAEARRLVMDAYRDHVQLIRIPWPPTSAPSPQLTLIDGDR